jgi:4-diphosphocytidyl-2-C-methyl-D-erythritol kinase
MRGVGERLDPIEAPIAGPIVVAYPGIGLDSAAVYRAYDASLTSVEALSSIRALTPDQESPQQNLVNDLEAVAIQVRPEVNRLRRALRSLGAKGVLMTGSGSAVFGVWRYWDDARAAARHLRAGGVWARVVEVLQQTPMFEVVQ